MKSQLAPPVPSPVPIVAAALPPAAELPLNRHVKSIALDDSASPYGLAVNSSATRMAVTSYNGNKVYVYRLPDGALSREVGGLGTDPGKFNNPFRCCFAPGDNILVAEFGNKRLQELTPTGDHRRFITPVPGAFSVCCNGTLIGVGVDGSKVQLYNYFSGALVREIGNDALSGNIDSLRFSSDSKLLFARARNYRTVAFAVGDGTLVRSLTGCQGIKHIEWDMELVPSGEVFVTDATEGRVCVYSPDGVTMRRSFGSRGDGAGQFQKPTALAYADRKLYVLDRNTKRVQVFE